MNRVVITGCGTVSSIGNDFDSFSRSIRSSRSGFSPASFRSRNTSPCIAGEVLDAAPERFYETSTLGRLGKTTIFSMVAAKLAMDDAGLTPDESSSFDTGLIMGSHYGEFKQEIWSHRKVVDGHPTLVSPNRFLYVVPNTIGGEVCYRSRIRGYSCFFYDAEVSSSLSVALAFQRLTNEAAESSFVAGGSDALDLDLYDWHSRAGNLATDTGGGERSRPFDLSRNGFIMGEGAGMLVLERLDRATQRKAEIHCEIVGCAIASSSDDGISRSMAGALENAGLNPSDIGVLVANANSSGIDEIEAKAIIDVFRTERENLAVTSVKSYLGETFGASGAFSLAAAVMILKTESIFQILNFNKSEWNLNIVNEPIALDKPYVMVNSIARTSLTTTSVSFILRHYDI